MGRCWRRSIPSFNALSWAGTRFESVIRLSLKRPFLAFPQICVKPRKRNVSGFPRPRAFRRSAANLPNSISRVFSVASSRLNSASLPRRSARNRSIISMLEAHHVIVSETHDDQIATRVPPPPLVGPQVEHVVEVDV